MSLINKKCHGGGENERRSYKVNRAQSHQKSEQDDSPASKPAHRALDQSSLNRKSRYCNWIRRPFEAPYVDRGDSPCSGNGGGPIPELEQGVGPNYEAQYRNDLAYAGVQLNPITVRGSYTRRS